MSADGYVCGPNGELDWMTWNWDDKLKEYVNKLHEHVDTILLGRKMADGFISHWSNVISKPDDEGFAFGKKMIDTPKIVFTKTLDESKWVNTVLAKGEITDEINNLKNQNGGDIIVYGGASFDSSLIKAGLIDEYNLFVNPVVIGSGMTIFNNIDSRQDLKLIKSISFDCGIVLLCYEPKG
jgi:dihydrofolate reductase